MTISVIIPVYNSEQYIEKCLLSLLNQSWRDFEIVLVDDGSADNSRQKAESLLAGQCNHTIVAQENRGASAARNTGIQQAKGEWITFVDSDDYLAPTFLEELMSSSEGCDMLISGIVFMNGEKEDHRTLPPNEVCSITDLRLEKGRYLDFTISPVGKLYRKEIIINHGIRFDEALATAEDREFNIDYLSHTETIRFIPYAGYFYQTDHEGSLSKGGGINELPLDIHYWNKLSCLLKGTNDSYLAHRLYYFIVDDVSRLIQKDGCWGAIRALWSVRPLVDRVFLRRNLKGVHAPGWQKKLIWLYLL